MASATDRDTDKRSETDGFDNGWHTDKRMVSLIETNKRIGSERIRLIRSFVSLSAVETIRYANTGSGIGSMNCSSSVEPCNAVVEEAPLIITCVTSSK